MLYQSVEEGDGPIIVRGRAVDRGDPSDVAGLDARPGMRRAGSPAEAGAGSPPRR